MATNKKKPASNSVVEQAVDQAVDKVVEKKSPESAPKAKALVEVDWGKGFVVHHDAVVSGSSIRVPIPLKARHMVGGAQGRGRYDGVRVKLNGQETRIGDRRFHKAGSEAQPSLTFDVID